MCYLCASTGHIVLRISNETCSLILEMPEEDKLHSFLVELKRLKQSMFPVCSLNLFIINYIIL